MDVQTAFGNLDPDLIIRVVETHGSFPSSGTLTPYPSYVNRVFAVEGEDGDSRIVKFYRPDRWSVPAIRDEHDFLADCAEAELPVITPVPLSDGSTLGVDGGFPFAIFPFVKGRGFEPESLADYERLGSLVARVHAAGSRRPAPHRIVCDPSWTRRSLDLLGNLNLVHPELRDEFSAVVTGFLDLVGSGFDNLEMIRIHGDCHRGNILDRRDFGLSLIDFDDMMTGPAVHDLWLLLPGRLDDSLLEMEALLTGYTRFREFDLSTLRLVEPLRFMRMVSYLAWCSIQRDDPAFSRNFPDWGTRAFWIREVEDLSAQLEFSRDCLEQEYELS